MKNGTNTVLEGLASEALEKAMVRFQNSPSGRFLLMDGHSSVSHGFWMVRGEGDENGPGRIIGYFHGALGNVIRATVLHPDFWSYGDGAEITPLNIVILDRPADPGLELAKVSVQKKALEERQAALDRELADIQREMRTLTQ